MNTFRDGAYLLDLRRPATFVVAAVEEGAALEVDAADEEGTTLAELELGATLVDETEVETTAGAAPPIKLYTDSTLDPPHLEARLPVQLMEHLRSSSWAAAGFRVFDIQHSCPYSSPA